MNLYVMVKNALIQCGLGFVEEHGAMQMTMRSGQLKWRSLVGVNGNDVFCCAQFPWKANSAALLALNELNCRLNTGCLMLLDGYVVLRCGAEIGDPMECGAAAAMLIKRCSNEVCRVWNDVFRAVEGIDEL